MSSGRHVLASGLQITLLDGSEPVEGALIRRKSSWWDEVIQENKTDSAGVAIFEEVLAPTFSFIWKVIPLEVIIPQEIIAVVDGREYTLLRLVKRNFHEGGEVPGVDLSFKCDLACDLKHRKFGKDKQIVQSRF